MFDKSPSSRYCLYKQTLTGESGVTKQTSRYALSIKQPWAALIVQGLKTIEVRRWPTARRGRILIHAARVPDDRPEAWDHVPKHAMKMAQLQGGIIGAAQLTECRRYADLETFLDDQTLHLNEAGWFEPPVLYGFAFTQPEILPFQKYPGWFRFFTIKELEPAAVQPAG
jgi:ASCH domain